MASNRPGRLQVGAEIVADVSHLEDLLPEFALVDQMGPPYETYACWESLGNILTHIHHVF